MTFSKFETLQRMLIALQAGDHRACLAIGESVLAAGATDPQITELLGYAQGMNGDWQKSVDLLLAVYADKKNDTAYISNLAVAYVNSGKPEQALRLIDGLAENTRRVIVIERSAALTYFHLKDWRRSIDCLRRILAMRRGERDDFILFAKACNALRRFTNARDALCEAMTRWPNDADILTEYANACSGLGDANEAERFYLDAHRLQSLRTDVIAALGDIYERGNRLPELEKLLSRVTLSDVNEPRLLLVASRLIRRTSRSDAAIQLLERALSICSDDSVGAAIHFELGRQLDERGLFNEAFDAFRSGNELALNEFRGKFPEVTASLSDLRWLVGPDLSQNRYEFTCFPELLGSRDPVFIVGFPRSGTTLLEQVLAAHPALVCMEEEPCVAAAQDLYERDMVGVPLEELSLEQVKLLRDEYYRRVSEAGIDITGKILVDKHPFNIARTGFIKRLFPDARVIFAARHPCDVILSCFMQNFVVNDGAVGFHSIESSTEIYVATLSRWLRQKDYASPPYYVLKYEEMVRNVFDSVKSLFVFLDIPWNDAVLAYLDQTKGKGRINTPSYHQVVRPIYQTSVYRWTNYRGHFTAVMPKLHGIITELGYENSLTPLSSGEVGPTTESKKLF